MADRTLYEQDTYLWSQQQADLLRALARSGLALPNALDLPNIAEEIESVGRSELATVLAHLEELLIHAIKAASRPDADPFRHWLNEPAPHRRNAERRYTPGMRQLIDLERLWRRARKIAGEELARFDEPMAAVPDAPPATLDELLDEDFLPETLVGRLLPGG